MSKKRKSVRFVEDGAPSDDTLLRMSKRRRNDDDDGDGAEDDSAYADIGRRLEPRPGQKQDVGESHHTLDSDEEEEEKYERLNVENVEGQEEATLEFDEETKITPFNMNEEMDEGHFDTDGTFIFNKKKEDIRDAWLDNIDWAKIKKDAGDLWRGQSMEDGDEESSHSSSHVDRDSVYTGILQFLQPKETVTKALSRLGGSRKTSDVRQARWKEKKNSKPGAAPADTAADSPMEQEAEPAEPLDDNATAVIKLTELVDSLVNEGEFEVYGFTYERISHELEKSLRAKNSKESSRNGAEGKVHGENEDNEDAELDMIAGEIDEKNVQVEESRGQQDSAKDEKESTPAPTDVFWEFKWKNEEAAETYGPYSSQQMQQWTDDGYFKDGVWTRRVGEKDAPFYSSKRIDFELYI